MRREPIVLLLLFLVPSIALAKRLDGSALDRDFESPERPRPGIRLQPKIEKRHKTFLPEIGEDRREDLLKAVESFTVILKRSNSGVAANRMLLSRAKVNLSLAQLILYSEKPGKNAAQAASRYLRAAQSDAAALLRVPGLDKASRAGALYVSGLAAVYSNDVNGPLKDFRESLQVDPESKEATWMAFYLAEEYFEANQLKDAIVYYRKCLAGGDSKIRSTAGYKLAWAYLNAGDEVMAERFFIWIPKAFPGSEAGRDALRDLAFLMVKSRNEDEVVRRADEFFKGGKVAKLRLEFLRTVFNNLEVQGKVSRSSPVFKRLLELETDPIRRVQLHFPILTMARREYASEVHLAAYQRVRSAINEAKIEPESKEFEALRSSWELETQKLIRSYVETFAGRVKSPEDMKRERVGMVLKDLFALHRTHFPNSMVNPVIFSLWLDVCIDLKDWECVNRVALAVAENPSLQTLHARAELERISALEEIFKQDPEKSEELFSALEQMVKKVDLPAWVRLAKRLAELQVQRKDYDTAIPLLERILSKDPSSDSHYRLQWARFLDERYEDVLKNQEPPKLVKRDARVTDLIRESALKLAVSARGDGNGEAYSVHLTTFLATNTDENKSVLARRDYFAYLIESKEYQKASNGILAIPVTQREAVYGDFLEAICLYHLRQGDFSTLLELLPKLSKGRKPELAYLRELGWIAVSGTLNPGALNSLSAEKRRYLVMLLALFRPGAALQHFRKAPPADDTDRGTALTALRLEKNKWEVFPDKREKSWLGAMAPQPPSEPAQVRTERELSKLRFPGEGKKGKSSEAAFASQLQALIEKTRKLRSGLQDDLKGVSVPVQLRILRVFRSHEEKIAGVILGSALPAGLTEPQQAEYRKGLEEIAREFSEQSAELQKLESSAETILKNAEDLAAESRIALPTFEQWKWPGSKDSAPLSTLVDFVKRGNGISAMIMADLLRDDVLDDPEDYFQARAGILLIANPSQVMQRYVWEELMQADEKDVINRWKEAVR